MIGGNVIKFYTRNEEEGISNVLFLVKGTGSEINDTCCVTVSIPNRVLPEIKVGMGIWWQSKECYLNVFGCPDTPFIKIGYSGGDEGAFNLIAIKDLRDQTPHPIMACKKALELSDYDFEKAKKLLGTAKTKVLKVKPT